MFVIFAVIHWNSVQCVQHVFGRVPMGQVIISIAVNDGQAHVPPQNVRVQSDKSCRLEELNCHKSTLNENA